VGFGARTLSPNSDSRSRRLHRGQKEHERQNRTPDPCHCSSVSSLGSGNEHDDKFESSLHGLSRDNPVIRPARLDVVRKVLPERIDVVSNRIQINFLDSAPNFVQLVLNFHTVVKAL
jgi:hypothetical protein